jgi:hypothetical protein
MAVLPLPPSNTRRYWLVYTVGSFQHRMQFRSSEGISDADAITNITDLCNLLLGAWGTNVSPVRIERADNGSDVVNVISGNPTGPGTATAVSTIDSPRAFTIAGRSTDGRKVKLAVFGITSSYATAASYEEEPIAAAELSALQTLLNITPNFFLSINGFKPTWYDRVTIKVNDHFVDKLRA